MHMKNNLRVAIASVVFAEAVGLIGTIFTVQSIPAWYAHLAKPSFSPPNWLFGPVWSILYLLMGIAAYRIWVSPKSVMRTNALGAYFVQLALNALWTPLFFRDACDWPWASHDRLDARRNRRHDCMVLAHRPNSRVSFAPVHYLGVICNHP